MEGSTATTWMARVISSCPTMAAKGKVNAMGRSAKLFSTHHPKDMAKCQVKFTL
jgi:hypothetical protein